MIKNYLKITLRKMNRQKIYSLINVLGLAIGMAGTMFILLWVQDEQNFDRFHKNSERIYRINQAIHYNDIDMEQANTPGILATKIKEECPEAELVTRVRGYRNENLILVNNQQFNERGLGIADEFFFRFFSFPLISGNPVTVLKNPYTVAISKKTARKYFGDSKAVGGTLNIFGQDYVITGVFEDMPDQSHVHLDILCSFASFQQYQQPSWGLNVFKTYVLLRDGINPATFDEKLKGIVKNHMFDSPERYESVIAAGNYTKFFVQPLMDIHLNSHLLWEFESNGNGTYVKFFTIIAVFILLIAVINYINLSTARSTDRAREIGIRKTMGSSRTSLIIQFIIESVILSILAFLLSLVMILLLMPAYRNLVGKSWLNIPFIYDPVLLLPLFILALLVGIAAGIYPAFVLSSFSPASIVSGKLKRGKKGSRLRNGLVVFQFSMTIILLIMTIIVRKQMDFIQNKNLGYTKEQVITVKTYGQLSQKLPVLKSVLLQNPSVVSASASSSLPGTDFNNIGMGLEGTNSSSGTNMYIADDDFMENMQMDLVEGRFFNKDIPTDGQAVILNESMARSLGVNNLLEKRMMIWVGGEGQEPFQIIGIIKDFNYESFHEPVKPLVVVRLYGTCPWAESYLSIRVKTKNIEDTIEEIQKTWNAVLPGLPFEYSFLDSIYDDQYKNEKYTEHIFMLFTIFMIFVACMGLLGMASFAVVQRTKEIAIRKVMGASVNQLLLKLTSDFVRWTVLANLIAWPAAYYIMLQWLRQFAYRSDIGIWPFINATLLILLITCLTVIFHAFKASVTNPIKSLHYE